MGEFDTIHELVKEARRRLSQGEWDYLMGGCESETTLLRNRYALDSVAFRPRVLRDVSKLDVTGKLLGRETRLPVALAPMGSLEVLGEGGAMTSAKAAERFGIVSVLSSVTEPGLEAIADETANPKIYQLYVRGDDAWVDDFVRRAIDKGYVGFCLTVDTAIYSRRERDIIKRYRPTARRRAQGQSFQAGMTWKLVDRLKGTFDIPLVLKGIATEEDAKLAIEHGVDVVWVSNHGGRQLDHGRGGLDVLPEVVAAVAGKAEIVFDGGVLRGSDVLKAFCLGATHVAVGKLQGLSLAAGGVDGIVNMLELLEEEMQSSMGLLGVSSLDQLDPSFLYAPVVPMNPLGPFSAHPLLAFPDMEY